MHWNACGDCMKYDSNWKKSHNHKNRVPKPREVWFVEFPFDGEIGGKKRPGIVFREVEGRYDVVMITSSDVLSCKDFRIMDPEFAGLDHDSTVRPERMCRISVSKFDYKLGDLSEDDWKELSEKMVL